MNLVTAGRTKWAAAFLLAATLLSFAIFAPTDNRSVVAAPLLQKPTQIPMKQSNTQVNLSVSSPTVNAGDAFDLIVMFNSDTPSRAAQAVLTFNPNLVEVTGLSEGEFYKQWADANGATTLLVPEDPVPDNEQGRVPIAGVTLLGGEMGNGPTGGGTLMIYHIKAKPDASGTAEFILSDVVVSDVGDATGRTQALAGVTVQGATVAIGAGAAPAAQPTPQPSTQPQARSQAQPTVQAVATVRNISNQQPEPTVARARSQAQANPSSSRSTSTSTGGSFPWIVVIPVVGVIVVGAVVFMTRRRK